MFSLFRDGGVAPAHGDGHPGRNAVTTSSHRLNQHSDHQPRGGVEASGRAAKSRQAASRSPTGHYGPSAILDCRGEL